MPQHAKRRPQGTLLLTACQIRMARAALRWPVGELARRSGVSRATLQRIESVYGVPDVRVSTLATLQKCLEQAGIVFLPDDGQARGGPGVCFARYPGRPLPTDMETPAGKGAPA